MSGPVEHAHAARAQALLDPVMGDDAPKPNVRFELAPLRRAHRWYIAGWVDGRDLFIAQVPATRASRSAQPPYPRKGPVLHRRWRRVNRALPERPHRRKRDAVALPQLEE